MLLFYDFEVFKHDWLVVIFDMMSNEKHVIVNDANKLTAFYESHKNYIWCGYNSKHYDEYILKSILLGMNPKEINDKIILDHMDGWQISGQFRAIPLNGYDVMPNPPVGLKTLEGFMGANIHESGVNFDIERPLTDAEIQQTIGYCTSDVLNTIEVFLHNKSTFDSTMSLVKDFDLSLDHIGDSGARITSVILDCKKRDYRDEFDVDFLPCLRIKKYKKVLNWYTEQLEKGKNGENIYENRLLTTVSGVPHIFAFGGLHGAIGEIVNGKYTATPVHETGAIYHVDVNNYYPSMLIAHDLITRSARNDNYTKIYNIRKALKLKQLNAKSKPEQAMYKTQQTPYKNVLNSLSGAMKDKYNQAYDPRNNNAMCINGQLMLLDLIEHLEVIEGFKLIQSNTDGLIVKIPDTDSAFNQLDDICYEWETRCSTAKCSIELALDQIKEIYQRDVNNYLWINPDGSIGERKGGVVKELSKLDYDLPIVNEAIVAYMHNRTPVEQTINRCNELIKFQKIVKLSTAYKQVIHNGKSYTNKCYRVFASNDARDGRICKAGGKRGSIEKFANTPDNCFIFNNECNTSIPKKLDRDYYINLAKKRLIEFGLR